MGQTKKKYEDVSMLASNFSIKLNHRLSFAFIIKFVIFALETNVQKEPFVFRYPGAMLGSQIHLWNTDELRRNQGGTQQ